MTDLATADPETLRAALRSPILGEAAKERIRAQLATVESLSTTEPPAPTRRRGIPNQTELRYADEILEPMRSSGEILRYEFEGLTLFIPDLGRYTPDYVLWLPSGGIAVDEVKGGHLWPDKVMKFKASAKERPWVPHRMTQWKDGRWTVLHNLNRSR